MHPCVPILLRLFVRCCGGRPQRVGSHAEGRAGAPVPARPQLLTSASILSFVSSQNSSGELMRRALLIFGLAALSPVAAVAGATNASGNVRSEERRVGKEC